MSNELADQFEQPSQALRDQLATALESNDLPTAKRLLSHHPELANADLRNAERRDRFTNGFALVRACAGDNAELAGLLLENGAHPDAVGSVPDDQPELGMPLHYAAAEFRNYSLANLLLDHGASPNGYPNCDQPTVERMYFQAREAGMSDDIVRHAYARFLPENAAPKPNASQLIGKNPKESIKLFTRMVDLGGQVPFCSLVRDGLDDLLMEIVRECEFEEGTPHDYPRANVFDSFFGAARWYGYPKILRRLMDHAEDRLDYESAICTIGVAIRSHNRDGSYSDYRSMIVMQLEHLKMRGELEKAQRDPDFKPLYQMATDFTWHQNYGYRAEIAKPECYVDLAELFVAWGVGDVNHLDPATKHSPLSAAVKRGHHPGIETYVTWLLDRGADLRESDADEVNPKAIATEKGHTGILQILDRY